VSLKHSYSLGNTSTLLIGTISPLGIYGDETISTMKFADRAMKVQVRAKANEIDPDEDVLVQKLRREVIHLREILQMRNNKTQKDINLELLNLKEENSRLKEKSSATQEVEKYKRENERLKSIIEGNQFLPIQNQDPEIMSIANGDNLAMNKNEQNEQNMNNNSSTNDSKEYEKIETLNNCADYLYNDAEQLENVNDKENNQNIQNKGSSFFITEAEAESEKIATLAPKKTIKPPLPSIMDVFGDSKAREAILSTNKKINNHISMRSSNPLMLTNFDRSDNKTFQNREEVTPPGLNKDLGSISNFTDREVNNRVTREWGLNEIRFAAQDLSQNMVNLER
jgi:hypothetical protein